MEAAVPSLRDPAVSDARDVTDPVGSDASAAPTGDELRVATLFACPGGYTLLDMGGVARLERFGALVVDRPLATALEPPRDPAAWASATSATTGPRSAGRAGGRGVRRSAARVLADAPRRSRVRASSDRGGARRLLCRADRALAVARVGGGSWAGSRRCLNLFAHTGAGTLVAAAAGARVTHVDGSRPAVAWARRNAALPVWPMPRSGGSWTTRWPSSAGRAAAVAGTAGSFSIRRATATGRRASAGRSQISCRPCSTPRLRCCRSRRSSCSRRMRRASRQRISRHPARRLRARWTAAAAARIEAAPLILQAASGARASAGVSARWQAGR